MNLNAVIKRFVPLLLVIAGIAFCGFGVYLAFFQNKGYAETEAVIERIDEEYVGTAADEGPEYEYTVYVKYTVEGNEYHEILDSYQAGYKEGKTIKVFYDQADPSKVHAESKTMGIIFMCAGGAAAVIGAAVFVVKLGKRG